MEKSKQKSKKKTRKTRPEWIDIVKRYQAPDNWRSTWQVLNSVVPFFAIWIAMYYSLSISYWLTLGLGFVNAGFMVRMFIIQHDCGHGSFYKSTKTNHRLGVFLGVLNLTPYFHWRKQHALHHATSGDLDFRGFGDIDTATVEEYEAMGKKERFKYRFYRHPLVTFGLGPLITFGIYHRFAYNTKKNEVRERRSVWFTNIALLVLIVGVGSLIGFKELFLIQFPITAIGTSAGVYLFYVQHQFEDTYWRRHKHWDYAKAALEGSSYFKLPKLLQWFSGNIGFHHIHHLAPLIPNYMLEKAYKENILFQKVETLTIKTSFRTIFLDLWDENLQRLISFREYRRRYILNAG
jgi:omega-6 fatty acid desaturase (delta-12 desaturase)